MGDLLQNLLQASQVLLGLSHHLRTGVFSLHRHKPLALLAQLHCTALAVVTGPRVTLHPELSLFLSVVDAPGGKMHKLGLERGLGSEHPFALIGNNAAGIAGRMAGRASRLLFGFGSAVEAVGDIG